MVDQNRRTHRACHRGRRAYRAITTPIGLDIADFVAVHLEVLNCLLHRKRSVVLVLEEEDQLGSARRGRGPGQNRGLCRDESSKCQEYGDDT